MSNNEKEGATAAISALAPAMKPKDKPTVLKPKSFSFASDVPSPSNADKAGTEAEVAASKLMKLVRRMGGGAHESP